MEADRKESGVITHYQDKAIHRVEVKRAADVKRGDVGNTRVTVNGEDISNRCFAAVEFSDGVVEANCYSVDDQYKFIQGFRDVKRETVIGPGKIERK